MNAWIEKYLKYALAGFAALVFMIGAISWMEEHDARLLAEQTVAQSAARVSALEKEKKDIDAAGKARLAALQKQRSEVKTPAQAIPEIPKLADVPLNLRPLPDAPSSVAVDAVPLFQQLNACKQTAASLDTCEKKLALAGKIQEEKDTQIEALKKPAGFWKRVGRTVKDIGIGVAIGYGISAVSR